MRRAPAPTMITTHRREDTSKAGVRVRLTRAMKTISCWLARSLALFLTVVSICLWIRSYKINDDFVLQWISYNYCFSNMGHARFVVEWDLGNDKPPPIVCVNWEWKEAFHRPYGTYLGFLAQSEEYPFGDGRQKRIALEMPYWFLVLLSAPPWLLPLVRWLRVRIRAEKGLCVHCGYDLRATPDRCPECGAPYCLPSYDARHRAGGL